MVQTRNNAKAGAEATLSQNNDNTLVDKLAGDLSKMAVGVGKKSYHMTSKGFAVYENLQGAVTSTDQVVKPGKSSCFTFKAKEVQQALLSNGESRLQVLDTNGTLRTLNIETGRVVNTWKTQRDGVALPQAALAPAYKGAGYSGDSNLLVSVAKKSVSLWDFRTRAGSVAEYKGGHAYLKEQPFTCLATSGDTGDSVGTMMVGNEGGGIKVFDAGKSMSRASTQFEGLGSPITSIDITCDGDWVLATTDTYLLLANRKALAGLTSDEGGYQTTLLRLRPADAQRTGNAPLKNARFSYVTEQGVVEDTIAASCGKFFVTWNFRSAKLCAEEKNKQLEYGLLATANGQKLDAIQFSHTNNRATNADVVLGATHDALCATVL